MFKVAVIGALALVMLFSVIPASQATLWELIISLNVETGSIYSGDNLVVSGKVVDHAYKPIRGAEVLVRAGSDTTKAFTDPDGVFRATFVDFQRVPGTYTINVVASWYGMTGLATTQFQVKGEASSFSVLQQQLLTDQAAKYLGANESDFVKDPIGQTLFKYYHNLLDQLIEEQKESLKPNEDQIFVEQQRAIAEELKSQAIEEFKPSAGVYEGYKYHDYINNLDPEIRDLVTSQLNFTKNTFENAQKVRDEILANGGTYDDARKAYLDLITIPKHVLEEFNEKHLQAAQEQTDESTESQSSEESEEQ